MQIDNNKILKEAFGKASSSGSWNAILDTMAGVSILKIVLDCLVLCVLVARLACGQSISIG